MSENKSLASDAKKKNIKNAIIVAVAIFVGIAVIWNVPVESSGMTVGYWLTGSGGVGVVAGLIIYVGIYLALCAIPTSIAINKGRSGAGFFILSFVLSPIIGLIIALLVRVDSNSASPGRTKCPDCAEYISKEAKVCKHCGYRPTATES
jgi:hypothetical protein